MNVSFRRNDDVDSQSHQQTQQPPHQPTHQQPHQSQPSSPPPLMPSNMHSNGMSLPSPLPSSHSSHSSLMYLDHGFDTPSTPSMLTDISSPVSATSTMDCGLIDDFKAELQDSVPGSSTNKQCQVCNDSASGFHYGVWSCEGCKAFYKRSIQGHVDYICPATNSCTIDKHRRKSCQACRLRKCYEVGMNKSITQRKERRPSGCNGNTNLKKRKIDCGQPFTNSSRCSTTSTSYNSPTKGVVKPNVLVQALSQVEMPVIESEHNPSLPVTLDNLLSSLIVLINKELVSLINWVKHIPGYGELEVAVQAHLIERSWMELLLIGCAFRSLDLNGRCLAFASDFHLTSHDWNVLGMSESFEQIAEISVQMSAMSVHKDEMMVLRALIVTNAEIRKLENPAQLSAMRRNLVDALADTASYYHPNDPRHLSCMLLVLPHVRQASNQTITTLRKLRRERHIAFSDLLCEVLEPCGMPERQSSLVPDFKSKMDAAAPSFWHPPDVM